MTIVPASARHGAAIEALLDDVFGSDRHGRTAYRLREGVRPVEGLSFVALDADGTLAGSIQLWPVEFAAESGAVQALTLLGPVAVAKDRQGTGIGAALMETAIAHAVAIGRDAIVLIGDPEYYGRFGFTAEATGAWAVPGPVERHRLLALLPEALAATLNTAGALRPAKALSAVRATTPARKGPRRAAAPAAA
ncbi:GNAT family N-acetyltransferase [Sphingosinicella microcystinivorans]|uniref:GNAT family N-acetyltransferase n=1 Tax=Sphingosinicella microcystinivorans TaxID=335406 RepID=UPI0022F38174|nr:N-acetyltransferase [Sphingosinicella microcystinivorans]WBX83616.1 N-acetyltransferase [Sphingosinicella microcystinivorans]